MLFSVCADFESGLSRNLAKGAGHLRRTAFGNGRVGMLDVELGRVPVWEVVRSFAF